MLKPVVARYQGKVSRIYFRADAAFAMPEVSWKPSGSIMRSGYRPTKSSSIRFQSLSRARPLDILTLRSIFGNLKTSFELGTETFGVRALTPSLLGRGRA